MRPSLFLRGADLRRIPWRSGRLRDCRPSHTVTFFDQELVGSTTQALVLPERCCRARSTAQGFSRGRIAGTKPANYPWVSRRALRRGLTNRTGPPAVFPPRYSTAAGGRPTLHAVANPGRRIPFSAAEPTRRSEGQYVVWPGQPGWSLVNRDGSPRSGWQFPAVTSKIRFWARVCRGVRMERDLWAWQ